MDTPSPVADAAPPEGAAASSPPWKSRLLIVLVALLAWFWTQELIGARGFTAGHRIEDALLRLLAPVHEFLTEKPAWADGLLIVSSAVIDLMGVFLLGWGVFGPSLRPVLGLVLLFSLRQLCQCLCALPPPEGMIWRHPGFPSLLVTYGVSNDLFFSGHTAIAVYGAIELGRLGRRWLPLAAFLLIFEVLVVLVLRAHWTMDVYAGAVTALCMAFLADRLAPACDRALARLTQRADG